MSKIAIVDDHVFFRYGLEAMLAGEGHDVVASIGDSREAAALIAKSEPDVVILDLRMPDMGGGEVLGALRKDGYKGSVIVFATEVDDESLMTVLDSGADAVLRKDRPEHLIFEAIAAASNGVRYVDGDLLDRALDLARAAGPQLRADLFKDKELTVARHAAAGLSNREIAQLLETTEGTIKAYLHAIYAKTGIRNRSELAAHPLIREV